MLNALLSQCFTLLAHNAKFDYGVLLSNGFTPALDWDDTMIMAHLLDRQGVSLSALAKQEFDITIPGFKDLGVESINELTKEQLKKYNDSHVKITKQLYDLYYKEIVDNGLQVVYNMERALLPTVVKMELQGMKLDLSWLECLATDYGKTLESCNQQILDAVGKEFNINSPKQLGEVLVEHGVPLTERTATGQYKTDAETLKSLKKSYSLLDLVLEQKKYQKLLSTYVLPFLGRSEKKKEQLRIVDSVLYVDFHQTGTITGRFSSSRKNLQNIPPEIRPAFIPKNDKFIIADYSQIELRLLAYFAGEKKLLKAFEEGLDAHEATAKWLFDDASRRADGKTVNFAVFYGVSAEGLASKFNIPIERAQILLKKYDMIYPTVAQWKKDQVDLAKVNGYLRSWLGRKYYFPYGIVTQHTARQAVNYVVQGSAAEICKVAMIELAKDGLIPCSQVHDCLIFDVKKRDVAEVQALVKKKMEGVFTDIHIPVEIKVLDRWE